jgi:hypothetical protein
VDGFINDALVILLEMALDGPVVYGAKVATVSALTAFFGLISWSSDLGICLKALRVLTDLLSLHPLNIVYLEHVGGIAALVDVLAAPLVPYYRSMALDQLCQVFSVPAPIPGAGGDAGIHELEKSQALPSIFHASVIPSR